MLHSSFKAPLFITGTPFCADDADLPKPLEFIPPVHRTAGAGGARQGRNVKLDITGVLLAKGNDVLQILEGSEKSVVKLFHKIREDKRHSGVVELLRDYGPRRRFENVGMLLFDLQTQSPKEVLQSVLRYSKLDSYLTSDDRVQIYSDLYNR